MNKKTISILLATLTLSSISAYAARGDARSESSLETAAPSERHYLLDPVELTPVAGFTVVNSSAGFNLGAHGAYPVFAGQPLYLEPSLILGFFSEATQFNLSAGMRYDITLADTKVRPFARVALGPTFQTSGSVAVFNASFGGGILYPIGQNVDLRAEASLVDLNGNAGLQILGGVSL